MKRFLALFLLVTLAACQSNQPTVVAPAPAIVLSPAPRLFGTPVLPIQHNPFTTTTNTPNVTVAVTQPVSITTATTNAMGLEVTGRLEVANPVGYPGIRLFPIGHDYGVHLSSYVSSNLTVTVGSVFDGVSTYTAEGPPGSLAHPSDFHIGGPGLVEMHNNKNVPVGTTFQPRLTFLGTPDTTFIFNEVQIGGPDGSVDLRVGVTNGAPVGAVNSLYMWRVTPFYNADDVFEIDSFGRKLEKYDATLNRFYLGVQTDIYLGNFATHVVLQDPETFAAPDGRWAFGSTNLLGSPVAIHSIDTTNFVTSLSLNNPHAFGAGVGTAAASLAFTRNRPTDTAITNLMSAIEGGNVNETTSDKGYLAFLAKNTAGITLVPIVYMDVDTGAWVSNSFSAGLGKAFKVDANSTVNTLTISNANVGVRTLFPDKALHVSYDSPVTPAIKFGTGTDAQGWYGFLGNDSSSDTRVFTGNAMNNAAATYEILMRGTDPTNWSVKVIADQETQIRYALKAPSIVATNGGTVGSLTANAADATVLQNFTAGTLRATNLVAGRLVATDPVTTNLVSLNGFTTNINVLCEGGVTNQFQFVSGVLSNIVSVP